MAKGGSQVTRCKKEISAALARSRARRGSSEAGKGGETARAPRGWGLGTGSRRARLWYGDLWRASRGARYRHVFLFLAFVARGALYRNGTAHRPLAGLNAPGEGAVFTSPVASRPTPGSLLGGKQEGGEGGEHRAGPAKRRQWTRRAPPNSVEGKLQALVSCLFPRTDARPSRKVRPGRLPELCQYYGTWVPPNCAARPAIFRQSRDHAPQGMRHVSFSGPPPPILRPLPLRLRRLRWSGLCYRAASPQKPTRPCPM